MSKSEGPVVVNAATLSELVRTSTVPVLVDFYADWCAPCKYMAPVLERFARKHVGFRGVWVESEDLFVDLHHLAVLLRPEQAVRQRQPHGQVLRVGVGGSPQVRRGLGKLAQTVVSHSKQDLVAQRLRRVRWSGFKQEVELGDGAF